MPVKEYPFYIKSTVILLGLVLFTYALINLRNILTPFAFAIIIAILLNPLVNRLHNARKLPRVVAIAVSMLLAVIVVAGVIYFLSSQVARFSESFPVFVKKLNILLDQLQNWLQQDFGLTIKKQVQLLNDAISSSKAVVGRTLGTALGVLSVVFLLPVYVFLFLFYKPLILNFLYEVFAEENSGKVADILNQTKTAIQSYMVGLLIEAVIVAVLNSIALLILNVQYAVLLGVVGAILNMLPYIGGIIALILPVLVATVTKDGFSTQIGIIIAYSIIQFIDNNILVPRIVSSKVQINALFSIFVVFLGGAAWGIPGMFLSIPFIAILKIIFDRIDDLKPWGKLLGDEVPANYRKHNWFRRKMLKDDSVSEKIVEESRK
jgi:predicted PurR-regulated permease PerM